MNGSAIRRQTFRKKLQGLDPEEVSRFLEDLASEFDRLAAENAALAGRAADLETQLQDFRSVEKALQQTLLQAQDSSAKALENARREAQLIIQDAEVKGAQIVEKSKSELSALRERITILGAKKESIVARLKMLLRSELDLVTALESGDDAGSPPPDEPPPAPRENRAAEIDDIMNSLNEQ